MDNHHDIKAEVLKRINVEQLKMRPKLYFAVRLALVVLVTGLIALISAVIFDFILFHLGESGRTMLLHFGPRGYFSFIRFFPWALLLADFILVSFLVWLLQQFSLGYRQPLIYILLAAVAVTFGAGLIVKSRTDWNERYILRHEGPQVFARFAPAPPLPPRPEEGVCRCTVTAVAGNTITAEETYSRGATTTRTIIVPTDSDDATSTGLKVGDTIFVVGDVDASGTIEAFGLLRLPRFR